VVKQLDENLPEHLGWALWRASEAWSVRFQAGMQAAGHTWYGRTQARLLAVLERGGTPQAVIADRLGLTKQAAQQAIDELVAVGVLSRAVDPTDSRRRIVAYTDAGRAALADADRIKRALEADLVVAFGAERIGRLHVDLAALEDFLHQRERSV
jgi:DNA-binding MarR family transcriptional regulator